MDEKLKVFEITTKEGVRGALYFSHYGEERALEMNDDERKVAEIAIGALIDAGINESVIDIVRKSNDYVTIVAHEKYDEDLLRLKYTPRTHWVSVPMVGDDAKENADNPLFSAQKNKRQFFWKAKISSPEDVLQFIPFIVRSYEHCKALDS
jgi:hypothetical protein